MNEPKHRRVGLEKNKGSTLARSKQKKKKNLLAKNKHLLTDYILDGNFYSTKTEAFIALISLSAHVEKSLKFPKSFCEQFNALVTILNPLSLESHNLLKVSQTKYCMYLVSHQSVSLVQSTGKISFHKPDRRIWTYWMTLYCSLKTQCAITALNVTPDTINVLEIKKNWPTGAHCAKI